MRVTIPRLRGGLTLLAAVTVVLAVLPIIGAPPGLLLFLFLFFIYLTIANMWNLLAGYSGLLSLCQPAFIGLAAYTLTILAWVGLPLYQGIIAGAIIAAVFAVLISVPAFRLRGIYFAIGTLIVPEALRIVFLLWRPVGGPVVGGGAGYAVKTATEVSPVQIYWLALIICMASLLVMQIILRSRLGLGLAAIRDNEITAASSGVDVFRLKLYSFVIGAVVTGIAGAIFYISQGYVEPVSTFSIRWTITLMLAAVIGGLSTEEGPIIGAVIVVILHFMLARYPGVNLIIQGVILVGIMLLAPQGIMGSIRKTRPYRSLLQLITRR